MNAQHLQIESLDQLTQDVIARVQHVINRVADNVAHSDDVSELQALLHALPMSTDEFGLATNRVQNAVQYFSSNTPGAAMYELKMLLGSLKGFFARNCQQSSARRMSYRVRRN